MNTLLLLARVAALLTTFILLAASVAPGQAATQSDHNGLGAAPGARDSCAGASDPDDIYAAPAVGDDSSCDSQGLSPGSTSTGGGEDSFVRSAYPAAGPVTCADSNTNAGDASSCDGGFIFRADAATGNGNLDGDYPIATAVAVTTVGGSAAYAVETTFLDYTTGVVTTTAPATVCVTTPAPFTVDLGGPDPWDPPAGPFTIRAVLGTRLLSSGPCTAPATLGPRDVTGGWSYSAFFSSGVGAAAAQAVVDLWVPGALACVIDWHVEAGEDDGLGGIVPTSHVGRASWRIDLNGAHYASAWGSGVAAYVYQDQTSTGLVAIPKGAWITFAAAAWEVGSEWAQAQSVAGGPMDMTFLC